MLPAVGGGTSPSPTTYHRQPDRPVRDRSWVGASGSTAAASPSTSRATRSSRAVPASMLDMGGTSSANIDGNIFQPTARRFRAASMRRAHLHRQQLHNVGTEFNFRNLTSGVTFDAGAAIDTLTPAVRGHDMVVILGGSGNDDSQGHGWRRPYRRQQPPDPRCGERHRHHRGARRQRSPVRPRRRRHADGGGGNDTLDGGAGIDTLTGGAGTGTADVFVGSPACRQRRRAGRSPGCDGTDTLTGVESVESRRRAARCWSARTASPRSRRRSTRPIAGDTILVAAGTYDEDVNIHTAVTVLGAQAGATAGGRDAAGGPARRR